MSVMINQSCPKCGMIHESQTKKILIQVGAIEQVKEMLQGYKKILVASDGNTRSLGAERIVELYKQEGVQVEEAFFDTKETIIPDERAISFLMEKASFGPEVIVGVGSGVLNDLCKYISYMKKIPYMIVATAPSMDGYASKGAALILEGMKVTENTHVPTWIVADTQTLALAPIEMIQAGIGDIVGKYSCLNDWKLAHIITGEVFCQDVYDMVKNQTDVIAENITGCMNRELPAIQALMDALVEVGIAMSYMGNSRPASGSEHHFSHFFEIVGILQNKPYLPHGIDVAYSAVLTCRLRKKALSLNPESFEYVFDEETYEKKMEEVFGKLSSEVIALQEKVGFYQKNRLEVIKEKWEEIVVCIEEASKGEYLEELLRKSGLLMETFTDFYDEDIIRTCIAYAKDLKDRYTVLWLLNDIGFLEKIAQELKI